MAIKAGIENKAKDITRIYCSPDGSTKRVAKAYAGVDGKAVQIWIRQGTKTNPYLIRSQDEWEWMSNDPGAYYRLENDFFLKGPEAVGTLERPFTGVFDGNGHRVEAISIGYGTNVANPTGLFGVNRGTVKNLYFWHTGYLMGYSGGAWGAFVGINQGEVSNCRLLGEKIMSHSSGAMIGGIAGDNQNVIENCEICYRFSYAAISGAVGGISGINSGRISCCTVNMATKSTYNYGTNQFRGMGKFVFRNSGELESCYRVTYVNPEYQYTGPRLPEMEWCVENTGTIENCGVGTVQSCVGFDFENTWYDNNSNVPRLTKFKAYR